MPNCAAGVLTGAFEAGPSPAEPRHAHQRDAGPPQAIEPAQPLLDRLRKSVPDLDERLQAILDERAVRDRPMDEPTLDGRTRAGQVSGPGAPGVQPGRQATWADGRAGRDQSPDSYLNESDRRTR